MGGVCLELIKITYLDMNKLESGILSMDIWKQLS